MYCAIPTVKQRVVVWLVWLVVALVMWQAPRSLPLTTDLPAASGAGVALAQTPGRELFPWWPRWRWRKLALAAYQRWQQACRVAQRTAHLAHLAMAGVLSLASIVDGLTQQQFRRQLGAIPVLYAILEALQVRQIINRYCPQTRAVDHGTVALVLILNRLSAPRPLQWVADWYAQTVLVQQLGIPASRFNDDRLGRTLDAIAPQCGSIWLAVVSEALARYAIDLRMLFYDLTAFVVHGAYPESQLIDFGFAHNTPISKRKVKVGLNVTADGAIPLDYQVWSGRTADKATVESNMTRLAALLQAQGWSPQQVLLVGDSANVDDRLVLLYDRLQIRYLASVPLVKAAHRQLVADVPEAAFYRQALVADSQQDGYWGVSVPVSFEHEGRRVHHRGLVVLSGPMRSALAQTRAQHFRALWAALREVQAKASQGARRYRTAKAVLARAQTQLRASPVGQLVTVTATGAPGAVQLHWQVQREALVQAMHQDGRYLLVTNDPDLTPAEMLQHYRQKDGAEKNFLVCKRDIRVSPIYLHQDQRIQAMLLLNMLALLAYRILERQLRQSGLALTTRRLIQQLESLCVIETHCWDGSVLLRLTPLSPQQAQLVRWLATMVPLCAAAYVSAPPHDRGYVPPWPLLLAC